MKNEASATRQAVSPPQTVEQPKVPKYKTYTLVLDLDETLVHFKDSRFLSDDQKLKIRPGVQEFLSALAPYYRMVVFTAAQKMYADFVVQKIDPEGQYIEQKYYRESCKLVGKHQVKDLNLVVKNSKIMKAF